MKPSVGRPPNVRRSFLLTTGFQRLGWWGVVERRLFQLREECATCNSGKLQSHANISALVKVLVGGRGYLVATGGLARR